MTLKANELRYGNKLLFLGELVTFESIGQVREDGVFWIKTKEVVESKSFHFKPIPLTEEFLLKCPNHKKVNGKNILNTIYFEIGRNRVISIGNIGTGNEAIWLCEIDPNIENRITDLVCIHNFDYDGKIMLHKFQNLYFALTNEELTVNL